MTDRIPPQAIMEEPATTEQSCRPHHIEEAVRRKLVAQPGFDFSSLVVHRLPGGVCIEGILETDDSIPNVEKIAKSVAGVEEVLNHLMIRPHKKPSAKG